MLPPDFPRLVRVGSLPVGAVCEWVGRLYRVATKRERTVTITIATPGADGLLWSHRLPVMELVTVE